MKARKHTKALLSLLTALLLSTTLVACGGKSKQEEPPPPAPETGSFITTYTVMDSQGRKTGTLSLDPRGTAELKDLEGNVIGSFTSKAPAAMEEDKTETPPKEQTGY